MVEVVVEIMKGGALHRVTFEDCLAPLDRIMKKRGLTPRESSAQQEEVVRSISDRFEGKGSSSIGQ
jgi:hypothetical protein